MIKILRSRQKPGPQNESILEPQSENEFDGELDLPLRNRRPKQDTSCPALDYGSGQRRSRRIEDVGVNINWGWRPKVCVIENIKHLHAQLYVEILRDPLDVVVLEHGEIQVGYPGADQDIATGIAPEVETLQGSGINGSADAHWRGVTVCVPKRSIGCGRNGEALSLDVIGGIAGVCKRTAARSAKPVRVRKIVAAQRIRWVSSDTP